jgi:UDP:flavonoid glycosyltransferase YjiC (YdhE family)
MTAADRTSEHRGRRHILVAWEFGGGMGHLTGVAALAARFAAHGHEVTLAVPAPERAKPLLAERLQPDQHVSLVQGVGWKVRDDLDGKDPSKVATLTLADVMMLFAWDDAYHLGPRVRAWETIVARVRPDAVVADFAPTMRLALAGKLPFYMIGTGYSMPPAGRLLPPIRPWHETVTPYSRRNEFRVLGEVNRIRGALKMPAVDHLSDLFHGDISFPCTAPLLDPYAAYRSAPTLPPHNIEPIPCGPGPDARPAEALVHLPADHAALRPVLRALARAGVTAEVVPRGGTGGLPADLPGNPRVRDGHVDLTQRLPAVRLAVHHGGLGLSYAAAMAGTPQLLFTKNLEHQVTAQALADRGLALAYGTENKVSIRLADESVAQLLAPERAAHAVQQGGTFHRDCGEVVLDGIAQRVAARIRDRAPDAQ